MTNDGAEVSCRLAVTTKSHSLACDSTVLSAVILRDLCAVQRIEIYDLDSIVFEVRLHVPGI